MADHIPFIDNDISSTNRITADWLNGVNNAAYEENSSIPSVTSATYRTAVDRARDFVTALDFMTTAQIADVRARTLSLDVSAALQAAIDATPEGGTLWVPYGKYKASGLTRQLPIVIRGAGSGRGLNPTASGGEPGTEIVSGSATQNILTFTPVSTAKLTGVHVRDIAFKGYGSGGSSGNGIVFDSSLGEIETGVLENVVIWNCKQSGLVLSTTVYAMRFVNVVLEQNGTSGLALSGMGVNQNQFSRVGALGNPIGFDCDGATNTFESCTAAYSTSIGMSISAGQVIMAGVNNLEDNVIGLQVATTGNYLVGANIIQTAIGPANPVLLDIIAGAAQNVYGCTFSVTALGTGKYIRVAGSGVGGGHTFLYTSPIPATVVADSTLQGVEAFLSAAWQSLSGSGVQNALNHIFPATGGTFDLGQATQAWRTVRTVNLAAENVVQVTDGVAAPSATVGWAKIFVDQSDGDLKIIFGDGTVKTIVTDT